MTRRIVFRMLAASTLVALLGGPAGDARAAYAYAVQQTSGYSFTGATVLTFFPNSSSSAAQIGSPSGSVSNVGVLDVLESYVGPAAGKPPENTFTPKGQSDPDYTRGDALITGVGFATNNVAELFLPNGGLGQGSGAWSVSAPITLTTAGAVSLTFNYTNQLSVVNTGSPPSVVQANFSYNFNIQNAAGTVVFSSAPSAVNQSISLIAPGSTTLPGSGTISIMSVVLPAGAYLGTITGSENVFTSNINVVPEPAGVVTLGMGLAAVGGLAWRRRRPA